MIITKTLSVEIEIDELINDYELNKESSLDEIASAVHDYVLGLDDPDYYLINELDEENICRVVLEHIEEEE